MKMMTWLGAALLLAGLSACGPADVSWRSTAKAPVTKVLFSDAGQSEAPAIPFVHSPYRVEAVRVHVSPALKVSERNSYYPGVDIVWRGEMPGNRHHQVRDIFREAFTQGTRYLDGAFPIELHVDVRRFHALTQKARYTVGGVHAITFALQKRDAVTGAPVGPVRVIKADLKALGGKDAVNADLTGLTQKVRITEHLGNVIYQELTLPNGYENRRLGPVQVLNRINTASDLPDGPT